jgi:hypothetical protein
MNSTIFLNKNKKKIKISNDNDDIDNDNDNDDNDNDNDNKLNKNDKKKKQSVCDDDKKKVKDDKNNVDEDDEEEDKVDEDEDEEEEEEEEDEGEDEEEEEDAINGDDEGDNENKTTDNKLKKKIKESFNDNLIQLNELLVTIKTLDDEIDLIDKEYKLKIKKKNQILKQFISRFKNIQKMYTDDVATALKTKPKRKSSNNGFIKPNPVPEILRKFLNLTDDVLLPRPTVSRLLNAKFNELGLKKGQNTQLSEEVCNILKLNYDDYNEVDIKLTSFQTFLATFYKSAEHQVTLGN